MKIEFDETDATVARAVGRALLDIAEVYAARRLDAATPTDNVHPTNSCTVSIPPAPYTPEQVRQAMDEIVADLDAATEAGEKPHDPEQRAVGINFAPATADETFGSDCCPSHDEPHLGTTLAHEVIQQVADSLRVDQHGVHFDDRYCGEAEEPFYTSGKMRGQWKKRRGVEESDYVTWYESQRPKADPGSAWAHLSKPAEPAPLPVQNVAAAFGAPVAPVAKPLPANAGELMTWAAELQAAGRLSQSDITAAYAELGLALFDIFESATVPAALAQERIGKLHALLSAKAGV